MENLLSSNCTPKTSSVSNSTEVLHSGTSLKYFWEIKTANMTASIDNIICIYSFKSQQTMFDIMHFLEHEVNTIFKGLCSLRKDCLNSCYYSKNIFFIRLQNNALIHIEFVTQWQNGKNIYYIRTDFNPNKCFGTFVKLVNRNLSTSSEPVYYNADLTKYLIDLISSSASKIKISKFDVAIDVPVNRTLISVRKDNRGHYRYTPSVTRFDNYTEYLGAKGKAGHTKIYNKATESHLSYDLTRIELTSEQHDNYNKFIKQWPKVKVFTEKPKVNSDCQKLKPTEKILLILLIENEYRDLHFQGLGSKMQKKLEPYLYGDKRTIPITIPEHIYYELMNRLYWMVNMQKNGE